MSESDNGSDRSLVANLLRYVLLGRMTVRQAMVNYPKDTKDPSLIAAYHAIIHYDADEDIRRRDPMYKQEQDDYIEFIFQTLERGEDLPQNIIESYKQYYDSTPILHNDDMNGFFKSFFRYLNIGGRK